MRAHVALKGRDGGLTRREGSHRAGLRGSLVAAGCPGGPRSVLGRVVLIGSVPSVEQDAAVFCASVVYPSDAEDFDFGYFATRHVPMFAGLLGDNCVRFEVHRALDAPGAPSPSFLAAAYFWVTSPEEFGQTLAEHGPAIYADIENFSRSQPQRGWAAVS